SSFIFLLNPTTSTAAHPHNTATVPPAFLSRSAPSRCSVSIWWCDRPLRRNTTTFPPLEVVHAVTAAADCFGVLQNAFSRVL
ncbi:hypothetical protein A2U01_0063487, partial [Trifolium medium]|nr:hypothetical protein [Trifolium medium]